VGAVGSKPGAAVCGGPACTRLAALAVWSVGLIAEWARPGANELCHTVYVRWPVNTLFKYSQLFPINFEHYKLKIQNIIFLMPQKLETWQGDR
jgi:hypothetical protein